MHGSGKYVTNEGKACEGEFRNHKFIGITFWIRRLVELYKKLLIIENNDRGLRHKT
jgi:hypothetical protein